MLDVYDALEGNGRREEGLGRGREKFAENGRQNLQPGQQGRKSRVG